MPEPTLTLCMIVRDVERVIEERLVSAAPFVDGSAPTLLPS
jgi:hypothetical protein